MKNQRSQNESTQLFQGMTHKLPQFSPVAGAAAAAAVAVTVCLAAVFRTFSRPTRFSFPSSPKGSADKLYSDTLSMAGCTAKVSQKISFPANATNYDYCLAISLLLTAFHFANICRRFSRQLLSLCFPGKILPQLIGALSKKFPGI